MTWTWRDEVASWIAALNGRTLLLETREGHTVALCSDKAAYDRRVAAGEVALSPLEVAALLDDEQDLDAVVDVKRLLDPAARVLRLTDADKPLRTRTVNRRRS